MRHTHAPSSASKLRDNQGLPLARYMSCGMIRDWCENFNCKTTGVGLYSFPEGQAEKRESKRHVTVQAIVAGPIVDLSDQLEVQRAATWILWDGSP